MCALYTMYYVLCALCTMHILPIVMSFSKRHRETAYYIPYVYLLLLRREQQVTHLVRIWIFEKQGFYSYLKSSVVFFSLQKNHFNTFFFEVEQQVWNIIYASNATVFISIGWDSYLYILCRCKIFYKTVYRQVIL